MGKTLRFLHPIKAKLTSISSPSSSSPYNFAVYGRCEPLKTWIKGLELVLYNPSIRFRSFWCKPTTQTKCIQNFPSLGRNLCLGSIFGISCITGSISSCPNVAYAMDGLYVLRNDYRPGSSGSSVSKEDLMTILAVARKLWLPLLLFVTVLINWGHPLALATKVTIFLFGTKPSPLSVYVFVDQVCQQIRREKPISYIYKSLYAKKVDVEDYKLLCLARVEFQDEKFSLIGILGSWWVLPSLSFQDTLYVFRNLKYSPETKGTTHIVWSDVKYSS